MKSLVLLPISIAALMTISLSATSAEPGNPPPQTKEFSYRHEPNYPNPFSGRASQPSPKDLMRTFGDIGVDPVDRPPIVEAFDKYCELTRKSGEELKAAAEKLNASLRQGATSPESSKLLQQAVDAEQSFGQAKQKAFSEVTKEMNDQRRGQTFLYIRAMDGSVTGERSPATARKPDVPNTEMPRPATGVKLLPAAPPSPAQPPAVR